MNLDRYNSLTDEQREAVLRAGGKAVQASRQYGADNDAKLLDEIKSLSKGTVAFNEIDSAAFKAAAPPIAAEIGKIAGEDFTNAVMQTVSK
jgi:TRAP-type C4-dicarboxylate transport system substrate-binding protein